MGGCVRSEIAGAGTIENASVYNCHVPNDTCALHGLSPLLATTRTCRQRCPWKRSFVDCLPIVANATVALSANRRRGGSREKSRFKAELVGACSLRCLVFVASI